MKLVWTAAVLLALGAPTVTSDDAPTWLGCAGEPTSTTGVLADYQPGTFVRDVWAGTVSGTLRPCRPPVGTDVFAVAVYDAHGTATAAAMPYPWTEGFATYVGVPPKTVAVCLIDHLKSRLDCIEIGWLDQPKGLPQPVNAGHLPPDSPLVAATPTVTFNGRTVHPGCPTCVDETTP